MTIHTKFSPKEAVGFINFDDNRYYIGTAKGIQLEVFKTGVIDIKYVIGVGKHDVNHFIPESNLTLRRL